MAKKHSDSKSKVAPTKTEEVEEKVVIKRVDRYSASFTIEELVHLRDLFNILLPPNAEQTVSQALAESEQRPLTETRLWAKIANMCTAAKIPMEDAAPDYVVSIAGPPTLGVFPLNIAVEQPPSSDEESSEKG